MTSSPPIIGFELGVGEFRIVTPEAVYQIKVTPELVKANTLMGVVSPAASLGANAGQKSSPSNGGSKPGPGNGTSDGIHDPSGGFFQEISQELFGRIGQLARQLSVSVNELPLTDNTELSKTGADLEDAKGQLEEVVEITEKASMKIMDLADLIQADVDNLNRQINVLNGLGFLSAKEGEEGPGAPSGPAPGVDSGGDGGKLFLEKFGELKSLVMALPEGVAAKGPGNGAEALAAPAAPPPAPAAPVILFGLDAVFQTLYEFCTNEAVKKHIKDMREDAKAGDFDEKAIEKGLSDLANSIGMDDGLYNFPLPALLKLIYTHTGSEKNKTNLKKMNQTVGSIFLDSSLPLEGREVAPEPAPPAPAAPEPAPTPASGNGGGDLFDPLPLKNLMTDLDAIVASGDLPGGVGGGGGGDGQGYTSIPTKEKDVIVATLAASDNLIKNTSAHLTHIMEALSFQDLSGQRIKKIVGLIGEIQVQLLSLLVSVDTKIKAHHEAPTKPRPKEETEKVAQAEVDKMLEKLSAEPSEMKGPGAENRLDQGAVNDLLSQLGF
ncbi:MAG: protein phosphatase CheZ [Deltaproteobacteria bacterium]|jgi:chemotaxis regulatin CheY-phosphate phosphatase CheZ|nr:protein phosphatase CheZ [Deltaproteobacteria bacterium]